MGAAWLVASAPMLLASVLYSTPAHSIIPARASCIRTVGIMCASSCQDGPTPGMAPSEVVVAQLKSLQQGEPGLQSAHTFMSPAYHERADALQRFSMWFSSPLYESLLACESWEIKGAVVTREEPTETKLADGRTFLGSAPVEQVVKVEVKAGRPKWAESGATGSRIGHVLPLMSYLFTVSLRPTTGEWRIDQIAPEAPPSLSSSLGRLRGGALSGTSGGKSSSSSSSSSSRRNLLLGVGGVTSIAAARCATVDSFPLSWEGPIRSYDTRVSMRGKTVLITGGNAGIGFETASRLAVEGASVTIAGRSPERMRRAAERIEARAKAAGVDEPRVEVGRLDLASLESVRSFAAGYKRSHRALDVLILNAGVSSLPTRKITADAMETQFEVNFLAHFLLTNLLMESLRAAPSPRVISVASIASYLPTAAIRLDDLQRSQPLSYGTCTTPIDCFSYHQSKLAQLFFTRELQRRLGGPRSRATVVAVHPGLVVTPVLFGQLWEMAGPIAQRVRDGEEEADEQEDVAARQRLQILTGFKTPQQGAQTSIYAAMAPEVDAARYGGHFLRELADAETEARLAAPGYGEEDGRMARALWSKAEELSGEPFEVEAMVTVV